MKIKYKQIVIMILSMLSIVIVFQLTSSDNRAENIDVKIESNSENNVGEVEIELDASVELEPIQKQIKEEEQDVVLETPIYKDSKYTKLQKINLMSKDDFILISGIGEKTAEKIINKRNELGKFYELEQLKEVSGIGDSKYQKILDFLD